MKNELTIQHLSAYLPYGLKVKYKDCMYDKTHIATLSGVSNDAVETTYKRRFKGCSGDCISLKGRDNITKLNFMPILRPLSDLTKEIEHNGEKFVPGLMLVSPNKEDWDKMICEYYGPFKLLTTQFIRVVHAELGEIISINHKNIGHLPYNVYKYLLPLHFDVFGLIEQGLAIDINTIQK